MEPATEPRAATKTVKLTTNDDRMSVLLHNAKRLDTTMFGASWPARRMSDVKASLAGIDCLGPFLTATVPDLNAFATPSQMWRFFGAAKPLFASLQRLAAAT